MPVMRDRFGLELEVFGTVGDPAISAHVDTIEHLCALGQPEQAKEIISHIPATDYKSRYLAWQQVKHAALRAGDHGLARTAGDAADRELSWYRFEQRNRQH